MKWNNVEQAMAKLEELYPDRDISVISTPAGDGPPDKEAERDYSATVRVGGTVGGSDLGVLSKVCEEVGCEVAIGPTNEPEGGLQAVLA